MFSSEINDIKSETWKLQCESTERKGQQTAHDSTQ